ncbi:MAG: class I SAM-dependent methyltransferase [Ignavibacteria bacterium]|nr:class I SAM-dependent methyltransferase [Ignavibacteria bacterium]
MWFEKWFSNKFYLDLYQHRDEEDARWMINLLQRSISVNTKSKVLDIACGSGRHSIELARRGFDVTGFDLSKYLITEAKKNLKNSKDRNLKIKFQIKDMRKFNYKNSFDIAVNIFTSFGYFEDDKENHKVIENVSDSLKKNGYFVFDFLNKEFLELNLVPFSKNKSGNVTIEQTRKIENGFVKKNIRITGNKKVNEYEEILKLYSYKQFKNIFNSYDLNIKNVYGDYYGNKFSNKTSRRLIIIAQKS